jgi:hypothetical protein
MVHTQALTALVSADKPPTGECSMKINDLPRNGAAEGNVRDLTLAQMRQITGGVRIASDGGDTGAMANPAVQATAIANGADPLVVAMEGAAETWYSIFGGLRGSPK